MFHIGGRTSFDIRVVLVGGGTDCRIGMTLGDRICSLDVGVPVRSSSSRSIRASGGRIRSLDMSVPVCGSGSRVRGSTVVSMYMSGWGSLCVGVLMCGVSGGSGCRSGFDVGVPMNGWCGLGEGVLVGGSSSCRSSVDVGVRPSDSWRG